jgi:signal peptidase I
MSKRDKTPAPPQEPRLIARLLGENFGTLIFAGVAVTVLSAWAIWDKMFLPDAQIPGLLYLYFAIGLGILGVTLAARYLLGDEVELVNQRRRSVKEAKLLLKEAKRGLRSHRARLKPEQLEEVQGAVAEVKATREGKDWDGLRKGLVELDRKLDNHLSFARKSTVREYTESIAVAVLIALFLRAFVVEAFKIPSGSMIPTLQVGDHIFVNKFIYGIRPPWPWEEMEFGRNHPKFLMGLRKPQRGEVIVFKYPKDPDKDFIKRIVAVEGDTVEVRQNAVYVNGKPVEHSHVEGRPCEYEDFEEAAGRWDHRRCEEYKDSLDGRSFTTIYDKGGVARSWPEVKVPPGNVFVMGDNRDNSHDSRYWGTVPFEMIKGKAMVIWWSSGEPEGIRVKRMGHLVE